MRRVKDHPAAIPKRVYKQPLYHEEVQSLYINAEKSTVNICTWLMHNIPSHLVCIWS